MTIFSLPFTPSGLDVPFKRIVTFLSSPTSLVPAHATPTSTDNQKEVTFASTHSSPPTIPSLFEGLQFTISPADHPLRGLPQGCSSPSSSIPDVRFVFSRPNIFKSLTTVDNLSLDRQLRWEFYVSRAKKIKQSRFNEQLRCTLKPNFPLWEIIF